MDELRIAPPNLNAKIKKKLTDAVREYAANEPRSRQSAIGCSEIGSPCDRQLALKSLGFPAISHPDPWTSIIGTAVHSYLEKVYEADNAKHDVPAWNVEMRVEIAPNIQGKCDLYDTEYKTVIDHKVPADSGIDKVRKGHISGTYLVQAQCYGYGFARQGFDVEYVALAFWPRGKGAWLGGLEVISYPYDESVVHRALERWNQIAVAAIELDLESFPERAQLLATADGPCSWCGFHNLNPSRVYTDDEGRALPTCAGHKK